MVKSIGILVFDDDLNHIKYVCEVLSESLGYHITQAMQCAEQIQFKGSYVVKSFPKKDLAKAEEYVTILIEAGLVAKIIPL